MMKTKLGLAVMLAVVATTAQAQDMTAKVELLGSITLPTGLSIGGEAFGGISGLDYDPKSDVSYAISDDRSQLAPARFYTLKLTMDAKGVQGIDIVASHLLRDASGNIYPQNGVDPEAIRFDAARTPYSGRAKAMPRAPRHLREPSRRHVAARLHCSGLLCPGGRWHRGHLWQSRL